MKKKDLARRIAFGGIGAAVSLVFILIGYFVRYVSVSCVALSAIGIVLPLTQKYYREAVLAVIVAAVVGFFIVNVKIVSFVMCSGFYVVLTVFAEQKCGDKSYKIILSYLIKTAYSCLVFWVAYRALGLISVDFSKITLVQNLSESAFYAVFNIVFSVLFLLYDFLLIKGYEYARVRISKIKK